jgi:hypothetical protein
MVDLPEQLVHLVVLGVQLKAAGEHLASFLILLRKNTVLSAQ